MRQERDWLFKSSKAKGAFWNSLGSTMYGANSFVMLALVSQIGNVEQTGDFGIAFTTAQILYIVGLLGVSQYQMTDYSKRYLFSDYANVRQLSCALMIICCIIACGVMHFKSGKLAYTIGLTILMLLNVIAELYQSLFFQNDRLDLSGSMLFYRTFWSLLLFSGALLVTHNVLFAIMVQILGNFAVTLYYIRLVAPGFISGQKAELAFVSTRNLIWECLPLFVSTLLMSIMLNASKYGVEFLMDDRAQGFYNLIFIPAQIIDLCSRFLFMPFLRQYEQLFSNHLQKEFIKMLGKQIAAILLFTSSCCIAAPSLGIWMLGIVYHKDISGLTVPLVFIIIGGGVFAICQLCYWILTTLRQQRYILIVYLSSVLVMPPVTAMLIKQWNLEGAALSFVFAHIIIAGCYIYALHRVIRKENHHA